MTNIVVPKPTIRFEGLDNIEIVGKNDIPMYELFDLYLRLEAFLKTRPEAILDSNGNIFGFCGRKRITPPETR